MLGGSCSPCCQCLCADACFYCTELSDGTSTWNSCTSLMYDNSAPRRVGNCAGLLTQPIALGCNFVVLGHVTINFNSPPSPFRNLEQGACFGVSVPVSGNGFYYSHLESTGFGGISTYIQASFSVACSESSSGTILSFSQTYYFSIRQSTTTVIGQDEFGANITETKSRRSDWTYNNNRNYNISLFDCGSASSKCRASGGNFALTSIEAICSIDELSFSGNGGLVSHAQAGGDSVLTQTCRLLYSDPSMPDEDCDDFLELGDALFAPPVLTCSIDQSGECEPAAP